MTKFGIMSLFKKKLIVLTYFFCFCNLLNAQQKNNRVEITGTLAHFNNELTVEDMSEFKYLLPLSGERTIIPEDSTGKFHISFKLDAPNYFRIGRNILYLSPGDKMEIFIDHNNAALASFKGKGSEANNFLRFTPFPKAGSYMEAGQMALSTPQLTIEYIIRAGASRAKQLDSVKQVSPEFRRLEEGRIKADIINSLIEGQISMYRPGAIQKDSVKMKQYGDEYKTLIKPRVDEYSKGFVDASLLKLVVYQDIAETLIKQPGKEDDLQQMRDWLKALTLVYDMKKVSDKSLLEKFKTNIDSIKTIAYRNAATQSLAALLKFGKGDAAIDFTAHDVIGNAITLSSLKGKIIYVDLWATWCGPCLDEMKYYQSLKERYSNTQDIVFVSLSIDDNNSAWKSNITERKAEGYQWLINRNQLDAYNVVGIPRALLIDKNFKMFDLNAPLPSSKNLNSLLDSLLK